METPSLIKLGIIQRKQGLQGRLIIACHQDVPHPSSLKTLFVKMGSTLVPYGIETLIPQAGKAIVKLHGVDDATTAHGLKGKVVFIAQEGLLKPRTSEASLEKLIGYHVQDMTEGPLGEVIGSHITPQQQLLAVAYQDKELLIPYHKDLVLAVIHTQNIIQVQLPKGFIEASF